MSRVSERGRGAIASDCDNAAVPHPSDSPPLATAPPAEEDDQRPVALLFVYTWDVVRALLALVGVIAPFSGNVAGNDHPISIPLWAQILAAVASACYAAALFMVAVLLLRRAAWVRRAQLALYGISMGLALGSLAYEAIVARGSLDAGAVYGVLLFALLYLCGIVAMLGGQVIAYFRGPGTTPRVLYGLVAFWAASSVALVLLRYG